jgi:hypothetical protein
MDDMGAILLGLMFALFIAIALLWIAGALLLGAAAIKEVKNFFGKALEDTSLRQHS